ncbi:hypothetical protein EYF80_049247 [Liparis tanakae]|uniref:Uncharacterized protein n=1 Tax=Liparis tanakae TaxID=230148 RepID=A0A4Z2FHA8_9TELE|nr:hypothetical protein EYF80_049247 [Liparis tanakae]
MCSRLEPYREARLFQPPLYGWSCSADGSRDVCYSSPPARRDGSKERNAAQAAKAKPQKLDERPAAEALGINSQFIEIPLILDRGSPVIRSSSGRGSHAPPLPRRLFILVERNRVNHGCSRLQRPLSRCGVR